MFNMDFLTSTSTTFSLETPYSCIFMYWLLESNSLFFSLPSCFTSLASMSLLLMRLDGPLMYSTYHSTYDIILITFLVCFLVSASRLWVPWRQGPVCNLNVCLLPRFRPLLPLVGQLRWSFNWSPCLGLAPVFFNLSSTLLAAAVV